MKNRRWDDRAGPAKQWAQQGRALLGSNLGYLWRKALCDARKSWAKHKKT